MGEFIYIYFCLIVKKKKKKKKFLKDFTMRSREVSRAPSVKGCEFMRKAVTGGAFIAAACFVQDSGTRRQASLVTRRHIFGGCLSAVGIWSRQHLAPTLLVVRTTQGARNKRFWTGHHVIISNVRGAWGVGWRWG